MAIGCADLYYCRAAHACKARIKCCHCILSTYLEPVEICVGEGLVGSDALRQEREVWVTRATGGDPRKGHYVEGHVECGQVPAREERP